MKNFGKKIIVGLFIILLLAVIVLSGILYIKSEHGKVMTDIEVINSEHQDTKNIVSDKQIITKDNKDISKAEVEKVEQKDSSLEEPIQNPADGKVLLSDNNQPVQTSMSSTNKVYCDDFFDEAKFKENLKTLKDFGEITVTMSAIPCLRQVTIKSSGEIFYANNEGTMVVVGAMIDNLGRNLTKEAMDKFIQESFENNAKSIDKSVAIKFGNGSNEVLEFTDPDCGYCRAAEKMFEENETKIDATRYVFFTPLDTIHPGASEKAIHVLCSDNPAEEYKKMMRNELMSYPNQCVRGKEILEKHMALSSSLHVSGTPTFYVNGVRYVGINPEIFQKITKDSNSDTTNNNQINNHINGSAVTIPAPENEDSLAGKYDINTNINTTTESSDNDSDITINESVGQ